MKMVEIHHLHSLVNNKFYLYIVLKCINGNNNDNNKNLIIIINNLYLPSALLTSKQTSKQLIQIEHNIVKNRDLPEAHHLAIYKHGRGATVKQIQVVARAALEAGTAGLRV